MNDCQLIELFPTLIYKTNLSQIPDLNKMITSSNFVRDESSKCWFSDNEILDRYHNLQNIIIIEFEKYINKVLSINTSQIQFFISRSWIVRHKKGDYGSSHYHPNSIFSGILYLKVDNNSGNIVFENHNNNLFPKLFSFEFEEWNKFNCQSWTICPEQGDLLFFPSHLHHKITESFSSDDRYVLAFDFFFRGKIGNNINQLIIK